MIKKDINKQDKINKAPDKCKQRISKPTLNSIQNKIKKYGMGSLNAEEAKTLSAFKQLENTQKRSKSAAEREAKNIIELPTTNNEEKSIDHLFKNSRLKCIKTIFEVMENGKGEARLKAVEMIEALRRARDAGENDVIKIEYDTVALDEVRKNA